MDKAKVNLIETEYKKNLKEYLQNGLDELVEKLQENNKNLNPIQIYSYIRNRNARGLTPQYSVEELYLVFEYYQQYIEKINEYAVFPPTQKNFCGFIGISTVTYNNYRESDEADRREIMEKIDNYITDSQLALAQTGKIKEVSTIYRTKAENKMIEAQAPIVFKNEMKVDLDEMMSQVKALKSGQPLELKQNEKGEYE